MYTVVTYLKCNDQYQKPAHSMNPIWVMNIPFINWCFPIDTGYGKNGSEYNWCNGPANLSNSPSNFAKKMNRLRIEHEFQVVRKSAHTINPHNNCGFKNGNN